MQFGRPLHIWVEPHISIPRKPDLHVTNVFLEQLRINMRLNPEYQFLSLTRRLNGLGCKLRDIGDK